MADRAKGITASSKLQPAVSSIHPSTTAVWGYAIGLSKLLLTNSFVLGLKCQEACSRKLRLYRTFLLKLPTIIMPARMILKSLES